MDIAEIFAAPVKGTEFLQIKISRSPFWEIGSLKKTETKRGEHNLRERAFSLRGTSALQISVPAALLVHTISGPRDVEVASALRSQEGLMEVWHMGFPGTLLVIVAGHFGTPSRSLVLGFAPDLESNHPRRHICASSDLHCVL